MMTKEIGTDRPEPKSVRAIFTGKHPDGGTALVQRTDEGDYAQSDDPDHAHAFGWWRYPPGTFAIIGAVSR